MHDLMTAPATCIPRISSPEIQSRLEEDLAFCFGVGRVAVGNLYAELTLYPKPGLVSLVDNGSHDDMTAATFMRSLFALRHYFIVITRSGMEEDVSFSILKRLGMEAEQRMMVATNGINTHRGAIFCLGLLCAAIGSCHAQRIALSPSSIRTMLLTRWGKALVEHTQVAIADSHGLQASARYATSGAREEAALGLPSVFDVALPTLRHSLAAGRGWRKARVDALFALMGHINDTNVYHRGGEDGALTVKRLASHFLALGGTAHPDWEIRAKECHRIFVDKKLSPGGAADLLAAACFVHDASRQI